MRFPRIALAVALAAAWGTAGAADLLPFIATRW
jgi:hypothetical protein